MLRNNGFHNRHSPFNRAFNPASLFTNGEQGWVYDPSNFATLFQDSAGTTPVTAVEQPVGLQLDLSQNLTLGPELVTNGNFTAGTTGWTADNTAVISSVSGGLQVVSTAANQGTSQIVALTNGVRYKVVITVVSATANYNIGYGNVFGQGQVYDSGALSGARTFTAYIVGNGTATTFWFYAAAAGTYLIDDVSIKVISGNHRFQATSANRPVVSARVNLLTKTQEFNDTAIWTTNSTTTVLANQTIAPDGTNTADLTTEVATIQPHGIDGPSVSFTSGVSYTFTLRVKAGSVGVIQLLFGTTAFGVNAFANFNVSTGQVGTIGSAATATILADANGFYICTLTATATLTISSVVAIYLTDNNASSARLPTYLGSTANNIFIWGADLRVTNQGVGLPAYQRVNTSTDYTSTGFPIYIKPNGSNQSLATNSINFTATDKMTVWQGVRKLSDASGVLLVELSTSGSNPGAFYISAPETGNNYGVRVSGNNGYNHSTFTAPITNVISGSWNLAAATIAAGVIDRFNGTLNTAGVLGTTMPGGNFGNFPAYFYARAGTSLFFSGNDYASIARGAASTTTQITDGETWVNSKTKAY